MNEFVVNLKNIVLNALQAKASLQNGCRFCCVVKANAYGLGAVRVAHALKSVADYFAVARPEELETLRKSGIKTPILVLGHLFDDEIRRVISQRGEIQVNSVEMLKEVSRQAAEIRQIAFVHLAFDTGMHRFGFLPGQAEEVADIVSKLKNVCVKGVFSHLANAENPDSRNRQLRLFESIKPFFPGVIFHLANSCAAKLPEFQQNMVRVGIDLYVGKHPAISLRARVVRISSLSKGESCGYSNSYVAQANQKIATISIGYADGLSRRAAGKVDVVIGGEKMRVVAVCMDSAIVCVPSEVDVAVGDLVTVFGKNGKIFNNIVDFASNCDTISYEVITGVSSRVARKYLFR